MDNKYAWFETMTLGGNVANEPPTRGNTNLVTVEVLAKSKFSNSKMFFRNSNSNPATTGRSTHSNLNAKVYVFISADPLAGCTLVCANTITELARIYPSKTILAVDLGNGGLTKWLTKGQNFNPANCVSQILLNPTQGQGAFQLEQPNRNFPQNIYIAPCRQNLNQLAHAYPLNGWNGWQLVQHPQIQPQQDYIIIDFKYNLPRVYFTVIRAMQRHANLIVNFIVVFSGNGTQHPNGNLYSTIQNLQHHWGQNAIHAVVFNSLHYRGHYRGPQPPAWSTNMAHKLSQTFTIQALCFHYVPYLGKGAMSLMQQGVPHIGQSFPNSRNSHIFQNAINALAKSL